MKRIAFALILIMTLFTTTAYAGRDILLGAVIGGVVVGIANGVRDHGHNHHGGGATVVNNYYEAVPRGWYESHRHVEQRPVYNTYQGICQNYPVRDAWGNITSVETYCR